MESSSLPFGLRTTMQTSPKRSRFPMGSLKESSMRARSTRGSPYRRARRRSSASVRASSSTPDRLGALVLAQQIVERLAEEDRLLLLHALCATLEASDLGRVQGGVRPPQELVRGLGTAGARVARRVGDADRHGAAVAGRQRLRERGIDLPADLIGAQERGLERDAGREERELVAADAPQRPPLLLRDAGERGGDRRDGPVAHSVARGRVEIEQAVEIDVQQRRDRVALERGEQRPLEGWAAQTPVGVGVERDGLPCRAWRHLRPPTGTLAQDI